MFRFFLSSGIDSVLSFLARNLNGHSPRLRVDALRGGLALEALVRALGGLGQVAHCAVPRSSYLIPPPPGRVWHGGTGDRRRATPDRSCTCAALPSGATSP